MIRRRGQTTTTTSLSSSKGPRVSGVLDRTHCQSGRDNVTLRSPPCGKAYAPAPDPAYDAPDLEWFASELKNDARMSALVRPDGRSGAALTAKNP